MKPEERARVKIDKQLNNAGWEIVSRNKYVPNSTLAVKEAILRGNTESDYLLFIEDKAIAVVEAKKEDNPLGENVKRQAEDYAVNPQPWYGLWFDKNEMPMVALHWEKYFQHIREKYNSIYKVQMPCITPHVCRHTFCSKMAKAGMNLKTLQYIMGIVI